MRVLLINPAWPSAGGGRKRYRRAWPPLDLLNAAALLRREGHTPELIDARAEGTRRREIIARAHGADLVLLESSPLDRWQCPDLDWPAFRGLARDLPSDRLVVAGAHGTVRPEFVLAETGAAVLIRGEPEFPLAALASAGLDPSGLPGLSYPAGERVVHNPVGDPRPLDDLSPPAYDLLDPDLYGYELLGPRLALLETSRGCPFSCTFCLKAMYGPVVRTKSLDRVLDEVEEAVGRWGAQNLYFIDLEFTLRRESTLDLCRALKGTGLELSWCCQTRVDTVDPELLAEMKAAGCRLIHFGIEAGAPRLLEATRKKITIEQATRALSWCRELGLATACFFLFGLPGETAADRRAAAVLARRLGPTFASFHVAAPYPGTELGRLAPDREPFPACLEPEHDLSRLAREARRAFLGFYLRPGYVLDRLKEAPLKENLKRLRLLWEFVR
ncbi:MAG: radical SAM protein [Thermodesulfobacteriota bacterium]